MVRKVKMAEPVESFVLTVEDVVVIRIVGRMMAIYRLDGCIHNAHNIFNHQKILKMIYWKV